MFLRSLAIACLFVSPAWSASARFELARESKPLAVIVLPADSAPEETEASEEIKDYVKRISGATLNILTAETNLNGLKPIYIGQASKVALEELIPKASDPASFALVVKPESISIRGMSPQGTLFGAYELLEQLGVRWFMPGELGTVVPNDRNPSLLIQQTVQAPSFASRWHGNKSQREWQTRMRMGGPSFPASHGIKLGDESTFEKHPEYYALVDGVRVDKQLCVSNPNVIRLAAEQLKDEWDGMGPKDNSYFCECPNCRALDAGDYEPFANSTGVTDRYVWFFNKVLDAAKDRCPNAKIAFYAYEAYMRTPLREKPNPRITPAIAPIQLCRIHSVNNTICPEKSYLLTLIKQWTALCPEVYDRGYWFNLADMGLPFSMTHRLREDIPTAKKLGIKGWRVETSAGSECHWGSETPSLYIAAKLMWNSDADVDALLLDFYNKFFGPAAKPMQSYFETMDASLRKADYHTGSMYDMPHIYVPNVMNTARNFLNDAQRQADAGDYGRRVDIIRLSFSYLEEFLAMVDRANAFDFTAANEHVTTVQQIADKLQAYDPPMLAKGRFPQRFLDEFCGQYITQGLERTTKIGELAAPLADEWEFIQDSNDLGLITGFWQPGCGGNWQKIKAYSLSWGDQGLRYYHAPAWYRQNVVVPEKFSGRRIMLWFGGVAGLPIRVWVNGTELLNTATKKLMEFDATNAIKLGQANTVVVRVTNKKVSELGVGGITAPVMFYALLKS